MNCFGGYGRESIILFQRVAVRFAKVTFPRRLLLLLQPTTTATNDVATAVANGSAVTTSSIAHTRPLSLCSHGLRTLPKRCAISNACWRWLVDSNYGSKIQRRLSRLPNKKNDAFYFFFLLRAQTHTHTTWHRFLLHHYPEKGHQNCPFLKIRVNAVAVFLLVFLLL